MICQPQLVGLKPDMFTTKNLNLFISCEAAKNSPESPFVQGTEA
jgi:hypothetical protein